MGGSGPEPDRGRGGAVILKEVTVWGLNDPNYPYRRGDFISVKNYPRGLGARQQPPKFYRIIFGFDNQTQADRFLEFMEPELGEPDENGNQPIIQKRAWRLLMDDVPTGVKTKFQNQGFVAIGNHPQADYTWPQIKAYLRRKRDNAEAADIFA